MISSNLLFYKKFKMFTIHTTFYTNQFCGSSNTYLFSYLFLSHLETAIKFKLPSYQINYNHNSN